MQTEGLYPALVSLASAAAEPGHLGHLMTLLALQLAVIMIGARLGGLIFSRVFKGPAVLGELMAGMIIGPYALGGMDLPGFGPLFPLTAGVGTFPVSTELYGIATLASIILLFLSGLETDLATFLRYSVVGMVVGMGGLVFSFIFGDLCAVWFGVAESFMDPKALFMGTVSTATSVGLTARILSEKRKMGDPEGVTILAAAVLDDVLGIVVLAIVVGMTKAARMGAHLEWAAIGWIALKAFGFWIFFTVVGLLLARRITRVLKMLRSMEIIASICLGLALLLAGLSEMAGLAMIIGAYIMGLALSRTDLAYELQDQLKGLYSFLIPVFFCVMGMLVNFSAMRSVLVLGVVYSLLAVVTKILGCGIPAWFMKFNMRGALRIGIGMVPRGEVSLIVAGIGLSAGAIGPDIFGVAIMMAVLSTLIAPPMLVKAFEGGAGTRGKERLPKEEMVSLALDFPSQHITDFLCERIMQAFRNEEFFVHRLYTDQPTYHICKDEMMFTVIQDGNQIVLSMPAKYQHIARMIVVEEILSLQDLLDSAKKMKSPDSMGIELLSGLFGQG
ncbi:MAG: cation:proton antiporter [Spartobacteria bacterium]|nr:cation:proton antiporter [Spartobacteria bacterium]